ncbi:MAG: rod shape-determining protein RodA [Bacteroidales bacterium]|nr:rod shape-determining protein RodA [Bacteroidales bacterium]MCF8343721.1 rod shape-determining protein RodA [Bacteroidales bacterium]MCF8350445.1 rod shape-determining protein RodA [Bacteroidales bacterium]MCF8376194.1 rod shape-determining protein RodA [Bacteroidales bacterium]MCF8401140.1 rod shape-determining protein RodA [Bacteroidales bacterium]
MEVRRRINTYGKLDWLTILIYLLLVFIGWLNIYASSYNPEHQSILDLSQRYGKQLLWIILAIVLALIILMIDSKFFSTFAYLMYGISMLSLVGVLLIGATIAGSKSWFQLGSFAIQPAEFAKFATCLAIAKYLTTLHVNLKKFKHLIISLAIIFAPAFLILLQHDTGSALVYAAFILVLYREGLSGSFLIIILLASLLFIFTLLFGKWPVLIGIGGLLLLFVMLIKAARKRLKLLIGATVLMAAFTFTVEYGFQNVLKPHQKERIEVLLGKKDDPHGVEYNVNQSKIAIGSGGFSGKGFLQGTQTKFDFVPEQSTDFIFCTIGEEWGFMGSAVMIILFMFLLFRIVKLAERQRSDFSRIYGYGVASILLFHFLINIGMTIGLTPVIGIPLPFISYGGSSLWAFTILLFIFLRLDSSRLEAL